MAQLDASVARVVSLKAARGLLGAPAVSPSAVAGIPAAGGTAFRYGTGLSY